MPSSATSSPLADATTGRSINVATCPNRGETNASRGPDVLTSALLQRRTQPGDCRQEQLLLVRRVEHREGRARGADDAESAHQRHRAMMPGPDGDALGVEQRGDVVRVEPFDSERDHGPAVDGHRRAVDRDPWSSSEALERLASERLLVLADSFHADLLQIFDRRGKPYRLGDRWRARLEAPGKVIPLGAIDPDLLDHLAAAAPGLQSIEHRSPAVHDADPGGPEHLVGREHVKVTSQ